MKLRKINLVNLVQDELTQREEKMLKGGTETCNCIISCSSNCSCAYAGGQENPGDVYYGGSSNEDNSLANKLQSFDSTIDNVDASIIL